MGKLTRATGALLMVILLSIGSVTIKADDPQGGGDGGSRPTCIPILKPCKPEQNQASSSTASNANPQLANAASEGPTPYNILFDFLLLSLKVRFGW